ncbi:hypothetical protein Tsubulata_008518, partial [Turnera subulata]
PTRMAILLFLCVFLNAAILNQAAFSPSINHTSISYHSFNPESCKDGTLICMGSVSAADGYLRLTSDPVPGNSTPPNQIGRVLFHLPVVAWPALITTSFTVRITTFPNSTNSGDGMTFIMAENNLPSPPSSYGSYLGIMDKSTEGGIVKQIAVELDTYPNEFDPDGNHVGIDTTRITTPVAAESLNSTGIDLKSGRDIKVQINYDSLSMRLEISAAYAGDSLVSVLNHSIDMSATVPRSVYVGFTASTGPYPESHQKDDKMENTVIIVVVVMVAFIASVIAFPLVQRALKKRKETLKKKADIDSRSRDAANAPKIYTYKELSKATHKFSKENLLGTGAFGSVYKGVINSSDPSSTIAVKKISATSKQGEKEYLAEICTIGRLRHKNIVQLQGWCHEDEQLLLVYQYMSNGSLDRYIGKLFLDWDTRYKILTGLASALLYLHEECGNPVVHRDIKPNNVMLDSEFNAHLGDFGLARLLQNNSAATTMLAGTPGYMAPEVSFTGKATPESDVYSFGMVVIEVVLGKRSRGFFEENSLVDYVWSLHACNELLECVDKTLQGKYNEEQVKRALLVALACMHPDANCRPRIRKVEQIFLNPNEPLMELTSRPNAIYITVSNSSRSTTSDFMGSKTGSEIMQQQSTLSSLDETCNVSASHPCPASLYYVPNTTKSLEETASLFNVKADSVQKTVHGFLVWVDNCSCPADHNVFVSHVDYVVQGGDTWESISSKFGWLVLEKPGKVLVPSQTITLDLLCGCSQGLVLVTYEVVKGDTLFTICSRFRTNLNKTAMLNKLENPDVIYAGQILFLPEPDGKTKKASKSPIPVVAGWWLCYSYSGKDTREGKLKKQKLIHEECIACTIILTHPLTIQDVAVKQMKNTKSKEFMSELNILCKIELIGYAAGGDSLFLVYEFAENGALSDHLHRAAIKGSKPLPWTTRVQIALDAARGLEYIHERTKPYYVHRDILGWLSYWTMLLKLEMQHLELYVRDGCVTTKNDVYSFGVVLMELVTAKPALTKDVSYEEEQNSEHRSLVQYMLSVLNDTENSFPQLIKLIDPNLTCYHQDSLLQMALLSKECVDDNWNRRPDMSQVVLRLSHILSSSKEWEQQEGS